MRTYERNSVSIDQCTECRGIFLDRGELERLVDAEAAWSQRGGDSDRSRRDEPRRDEPRHEKPRYAEPHYNKPRHDDDDDDDDRREHGYQEGYRKPRKKKSFFEEMFD